MLGLGTLIERLIDDDPKNLHRWRTTVGYIMLGVLAALAWVGTAMTAGVPGPGKVIFERDLQQHVDKAVAPVKEDVKKVQEQQALDSKKLDAVLEQINESLAQTKAAEIRQLIYKRCHLATYEERETINAEIERKQVEYRKLKNERYDAPSCQEL